MSTMQCSIPENIRNVVNVSDIYQNIGANGNPTSFGIDLKLDELGLRKSLKSKELSALKAKIEDTLFQWSSRYEKHQEKQYKLSREQHAEKLNTELHNSFDELSRILQATLYVDDSVNWGKLKSHETFSIKPKELFEQGETVPAFIEFDKNGRPVDFTKISYPGEPTRDIAKQHINFVVRLLMPKKVDEKFNELIAHYNSEVQKIDNHNEERAKIFEKVHHDYEILKNQFLEKQAQQNQTIDELQNRYLKGEPDAIEEHVDIVFQNSSYPEHIPRNWDVEYRPDSEMLVISLQLPSPDDLPSEKQCKYVKTRDEIDVKYMADAEKRKLYYDVIYNMILRTLHEVFESDTIDAIKIAAINGYTDSINPATGKYETKTIASISADKQAFEDVNLENIDPKQTFKHFKGVAAAKLSDLAPVPPVIEMNKSDKRFIESEEVAWELGESTNIAAMAWQDFEYLIRELFHSEFSQDGGEVKVTQESADGGVDAIAFDNDPLRGGKIVIQAKRYTNVVGVSAVRDLYGTVMNEGATSGILVTTSDYGKDAYEFAKDKPLKLLNGSNLLSLLERHGHKARIDTAEAKKMVSNL